MNIRLVASPILVLLLSHYAPGQPMPRVADETGPPMQVAANASDVYKQKLMLRIAVEEAAVRQAESVHATNVELSKAYVQLGVWYQAAAQWERSEAALEHAISLVRHTSEAGADLATALGHLASLHVMMGKFPEAERENQEALRLRQGLGDQLLIARSRDDLAIFYVAKQKFEKAKS